MLFPFTTILTVEVVIIVSLTIQAETNFLNTQGINLKYFIKNRMDRHFVFIGVALVENELLRAYKKTRFLLYAGYGYAYRFGNKNQWVFDNRIALGATTNADRNSIHPVIKTGIGRIF